MLNIEPEPNRNELGFKDSVLDSFSFLLCCGFHLAQSEVTFVRYESSSTFINIYHGRASFELGIEIGRLSLSDETVNLFEIIEWAKAETAEGFGQHVMFQASTRATLRQLVPKLSNLVRKYAAPFLEGNGKAYQSVAESSIRSRISYESEVNLRALRREAEVAWQSKDYVQIITLYTRIGADNLTEVESKRLSYAEHHSAHAEKQSPEIPI